MKTGKIVARELRFYLYILILMFLLHLTNVWIAGSFGGLLLNSFIMYIPTSIIAWIVRLWRAR